jgi:DNA-binding transcriptional MerR regulator
MNKLNSAYKSIGEVARILELNDEKKGRLKTHTIRFWEKKFKQIKPKLFNTNRRYYDQNSIDILKKIKYLLKDEGMTIEGVKKMLNKNKSLKLDDHSNKPINTQNNNLKIKLNKISKIITELKDLK